MIKQLQAVFSPAPDFADNPVLLLRKRYIQVVAILYAVLVFMGFVIIQVLSGGALQPAAVAQIFGVIGMAMITLLIVQTNRITLASAFIIMLTAFSVYNFTLNDIILIFSVIAIITSAILGTLPIHLVVNFLVFVRIITYPLLGVPITEERPLVTAIFEVFSMAFPLVFISITVRFVVDRTIETARRVSRSASLLQSTAEVGQTLSQLLNLDDLLSRAVDMIRDRFAFYHVQVFLVDEQREYANLVASTGEVGQRLIARKHRLPVGSQSVIGRVTQAGEAVISRDTDTDSVHAVNELLPNTRSELALPIMDAERIIGVLDVQSTRRGAFLEDDVQALQVMANQLATAIRNAMLFENIQHNLQENKRLFLEAEANLRENQRLTSQLTTSVWAGYLGTSRDVSAITLEQSEGVPHFNADWTDTMRESQRRLRPITRNEQGQQITAVPIVLRGAVIGAIEVSAEDVRENDMIEMMNAVAQRLATNLDNVRLYEEAQEATLQEQKINTVVARYQSANSIDELLQITLAELTDALGAEQGTIRLGFLEGEENAGTSIGRAGLTSSDSRPKPIADLSKYEIKGSNGAANGTNGTASASTSASNGHTADSDSGGGADGGDTDGADDGGGGGGDAAADPGTTHGSEW